MLEESNLTFQPSPQSYLSSAFAERARARSRSTSRATAQDGVSNVSYSSSSSNNNIIIKTSTTPNSRSSSSSIGRAGSSDKMSNPCRYNASITSSSSASSHAPRRLVRPPPQQ